MEKNFENFYTVKKMIDKRWRNDMNGVEAAQRQAERDA